MSTHYESSMHFDVAPDVVFAAQSNADYVVWKHEHMASYDVSANVTTSGSTITISSSRKLPAKIPSVAKPFVGDAITVNEVHVWSPPDAQGVRSGKVSATFPGAPMRVDGTLKLRAEGSGSVLEVAIDAASTVPMVGGKLEQIAGEQFMRALRKEQQIAPLWFAAGGPPADTGEASSPTGSAQS